MADGGQFPWKRQLIDQSRGPAGTYDAVHRSLPDLPNGVAWQKNPETREWTLVRMDQQSNNNNNKLTIKSTTNPTKGGRERLLVNPVRQKSQSQQLMDNDDDDVNSAKISTDDMLATATAVTAVGGDTMEEKKEDNDTARPLLGKDYIVHTIVPSDTFAGLCLRYKIKAVTLRRINQFSGSNLALAPSQLLIPLDGETRSLDKIQLQDTSSHEYKMQEIVREFPHLMATERKAYLEMNDWNLDSALEEIRQDLQWEQDNICVAVALDQDKAVMANQSTSSTSGRMFKPLEVDAK